MRKLKLWPTADDDGRPRMTAPKGRPALYAAGRNTDNGSGLETGTSTSLMAVAPTAALGPGRDDGYGRARYVLRTCKSPT